MPTLLKSWDGGEGAGKIVEIDESCFGRSQYNRGRIRSTMGVWRCQAGVGGPFLYLSPTVPSRRCLASSIPLSLVTAGQPTFVLVTRASRITQ